MTRTEATPNKTDNNRFDDRNQLTHFMGDQRIADTRMRSSFEDAQ